MSAVSLDILDKVPRPLHKGLRRLRWFNASFREQVETAEQASGVRFAVDERKLSSAFLEWLRAFEAQKPRDPGERRAYVGFASGLMLRSLLTHKPISLTSRPAASDEDPVLFWPEGYVYVTYCLNVRAAVLDQDFHEDKPFSAYRPPIRTWWSFKENVSEDPSLAIAFLDLFAGEEPNWSMPSVFSAPGPAALT